MTCNNHSNKDDGSTFVHPAHLGDSESTADLVNAVAKLIESGASKEDINALIDALNQHGSMAAQPPDAQSGGSGSQPVEAMPFVPLFNAVGKAWQDWGVNEADFDENTFNETLPLTLADRLNQAQAAYGEFATQLHTLGQLCSSEAEIEAALQLGKSWGQFSKALQAVGHSLSEGTPPGEGLYKPAEAVWQSWLNVQATTADISNRLQSQRMAGTLDVLAAHQRWLDHPLQGFTDALAVPLEKDSSFLLNHALSFGRANLAIVQSFQSMRTEGFTHVASGTKGGRYRFTCAKACPFLGCYTLACTEWHTLPQCTPWRRIVGPVGGPSGVYHRVCTWVVRQTQSDTCCCYKSRWERFLGLGACICWGENRGPWFTTARTQEWSAILMTPPAATLPPNFSSISAGAC